MNTYDNLHQMVAANRHTEISTDETFSGRPGSRPQLQEHQVDLNQLPYSRRCPVHIIIDPDMENPKHLDLTEYHNSIRRKAWAKTILPGPVTDAAATFEKLANVGAENKNEVKRMTQYDGHKPIFGVASRPAVKPMEDTTAVPVVRQSADKVVYFDIPGFSEVAAYYSDVFSDPDREQIILVIDHQFPSQNRFVPAGLTTPVAMVLDGIDVVFLVTSAGVHFKHEHKEFLVLKVVANYSIDQYRLLKQRSQLKENHQPVSVSPFRSLESNLISPAISGSLVDGVPSSDSVMAPPTEQDFMRFHQLN